MSLFSIAKTIGKDLIKVASIANPFNLNPVQKIREGLEIATNTSIPLSKEEKKINVALAVPVGATIGGLVGGPAGAVKGALIVPTVQATIQESPKVSKFITDTATNFLTGETQEKGGSIIANVVEGNVSLKDISGEDVRNAGLAIGGVGLAVGAGTLAYDYLKDKKKDVEDKVLDTSTILTPVKTGETSSVGTPTVAPTRETQTITSGAKRRKSKKKEHQSIRQTVNVMVNNSANRITKKYLNVVPISNYGRQLPIRSFR